MIYTFPLTPDGIASANSVAGQKHVWRDVDSIVVYTQGDMPEPPPLPAITPRQCRLALLAIGKLDAVESAISAAGPEAKIVWEYSTELDRKHPLIDSMAEILRMSSGQVDALWREASTL